MQLGVLLTSLLWALFWYWDTARSMAGIWWRSETFAHGLVVYPIACWLIWRKRREVLMVRCGFSLLGLIGVIIAGSAWLLGDLGGVEAARHFGFVLLLICSVWAVLGTSVSKAIAFPLAFTLLAVPAGEFMLPMLIEHTADFTVGALRLTGIPVYREGNSFVVPSGHWSVVEACSGLRYLIASVTLGLLYAYLSFRSALRRSLFVVASVVVPIVANWIRAYMIVMIGHLSGMKYAVGVDHLLYGWLFFGIVMLLLFWVGSFWREEAPEQPQPVSDRYSVAAHPAPSRTIIGALLSAAAIGAAPVYSNYLNTQPSVGSVVLRVPPPAGSWRNAVESDTKYRPHYQGARAAIAATYTRNGHEVGLYLAYYSDERQGQELIGQENGLTERGSRQWQRLSSRARPADPSGIESEQTQLRSGQTELTVRRWYWVGGNWIRREEQVKFRQALGRLLGRGDDAAVVIVFTPSSSRAADAERALDAFVAEMSPAIEKTLRTARSSASGAGTSVGR